jgi:hypothetical protein
MMSVIMKTLLIVVLACGVSAFTIFVCPDFFSFFLQILLVVVLVSIRKPRFNREVELYGWTKLQFIASLIAIGAVGIFLSLLLDKQVIYINLANFFVNASLLSIALYSVEEKLIGYYSLHNPKNDDPAERRRQAGGGRREA